MELESIINFVMHHAFFEGGSKLPDTLKDDSDSILYLPLF